MAAAISFRPSPQSITDGERSLPFCLLPMLTELGPAGMELRLQSSEWNFVPEQWEVQKWAQVFARLGVMQNLIYCAPRLTGSVFSENGVPGTDGGLGLSDANELRLVGDMVQRALDRSLTANPTARIAVLQDGPYGVPVLVAEDMKSFRP